MSKLILWVSVILLLSACRGPAASDRDFAEAIQIAVQSTLTAEASSLAIAPTELPATSTPLPPTPTLLHSHSDS